MGRAFRITRNWLMLGLSTLALAWVCLVLLVPTGPLRKRVQALLSDRIGETVQLNSVSIGLLGQFTASGVSMGQPESPWLRIDRISLPLDIVALFQGTLQPEHCRVEGLHVVAHRTLDGAWKIGPDLKNRTTKKSEAAPSAESDPDAEPSRVEIEVAGGSLMVADDPTGTHIELTDLAGQIAWEPGQLTVEQITGRLSGGLVTLATLVKQNPDGTSIEGTLKAQDVRLNQEEGALSYFVPMLTNRSGGLSGRLRGEMVFRTQGTSANDLTTALAGSAQLQLEELQLSGSQLLEEVNQMLKLPARAKLGRATGSFVVQNQRISTQDLTIHTGGTPILLMGWTDFSGQVDYKIKSEALASRVNELADQLPPEARRIAQELNLTGEIDRLTELRLQGTRADLRLMAAGANQNGNAERLGQKSGIKIDLDRAGKALRDMGTRPRTSIRR